MISSKNDRTRYIVPQCVEFCAAHKDRIIFGLTDAWNVRPLMLALLVESELVSMLMSSLSKAYRLHHISVLERSLTYGFIQCTELVTLILKKNSTILPMTARERAIPGAYTAPVNPKKQATAPTFTPTPGSVTLDKTSAGAESLSKERDTMDWSQQVDITVYGCLRSMLTAIRNMVELPSVDAIEPSNTIRTVLGVTMDVPNLQHIASICTFMSHRVLDININKQMLDIVTSCLGEAFYVGVVHCMLFMDSKSKKFATPIEQIKDLATVMTNILNDANFVSKIASSELSFLTECFAAMPREKTIQEWQNKNLQTQQFMTPNPKILQKSLMNEVSFFQ